MIGQFLLSWGNFFSGEKGGSTSRKYTEAGKGLCNPFPMLMLMNKTIIMGEGVSKSDETLTFGYQMLVARTDKPQRHIILRFSTALSILVDPRNQLHPY